ncbi:MAG: hypothetical protein KAT00_06105 [Planctomycetes bacterium]|nr:hypothetical protein [Planctomycetota bacterium]
MKRSLITATLLIIALTLVLCLFTGCDSLRRAPSEPLKQNAYLCADATQKILDGGTDAGSPLANIANMTAKNTQTYFGSPQGPIAPPEITIPAAAVDAKKRPNPWDLADNAITLGIAVAGIFGGVGGIKAAAFLTAARRKSKALRQLVIAQQNFRNELANSASSDETIAAAEVLNRLKAANNDTQTASTQSIVTEIKTEARKGHAA